MEGTEQGEGVEGDEEPVVPKILTVSGSGELGETDRGARSSEIVLGPRADDFIEAVMKTVGVREGADSSVENQDLLSLTHELDTLLDTKNNLSTPPPLIDLSPFECTKLQQEELETLRAIYGDDMRCLSETCFVVDIKFLTDAILDHDVIKIWFSFPPNYPCVPPVFELEASQSGVVSYSEADELYDCFVTASFKKIGEMMIFDLVTMAQDFMSSLIQRKCKQEKERKKADQLQLEAEEAAKKTAAIKPPAATAEAGAETNNPIGEKVISLLWSGVLLKPTQFIGRISEIIKKLPDNLEITRIENVLRQDLAERFCKTLKEASSQLWKKERSYPHEINLKPEVAFHGTVTSNLPSIVQQGLVIPGQGNKVKVRCGSSLGLGIYLSPKPEYSLGYSSLDRLIVCAALQGRIYKVGANSHAPHSRFSSVMSSCGNEWVFFNAGQVLPCYVIKVQKCDPKRRLPQPPPLHALLSSKGASQTGIDRKTALLARARKFLPYGFGPGTQTIIEDAGSFDDDEEDYGEYQESRHTDKLKTGYEFQDYRWQND